MSGYERFTDRARKIMQLANQEAQRLNHEYIGTEHILLGLIKEGSGVAANVLKNLDVSLHKAEELVKNIVQAGPDMVTMGKLPQTPRAKKVVEYAIEEARNLNHSYLGTEHLLLGLLREKEGVASQVLNECGCKLEDVKEEVLMMLGKGIAKEEESPKRYNEIMERIRELSGLPDCKLEDVKEEVLMMLGKGIAKEEESPKRYNEIMERIRELSGLPDKEAFDQIVKAINAFKSEPPFVV